MMDDDHVRETATYRNIERPLDIPNDVRAKVADMLRLWFTPNIQTRPGIYTTAAIAICDTIETMMNEDE